MGYTHYFGRKEVTHDPETFKRFMDDVRTLVDNLPERSLSSGGYASGHLLKLAGGDATGKPIFNDTELLFNGADGGEDLGHESMWICQDYEFSEGSYGDYQRANFNKKGEIFGFCKTARKPYDIVVQAVLILYKEYFGNKVGIGSDGCASDWQQAFELVSSVFKRKQKGDTLEEQFEYLTGDDTDPDIVI